MQISMPKRLSSVATFFVLASFLVSCSKNYDEMVAPSNVTSSGTYYTTPASSLTSSGYNGLSVNFNNSANGAYGYAQSLLDFKSVNFWGEASRSSIVDGKLRISVLKNLLGGAGANISRIDAPDGTEYQLSYDMMFDNNFDFSWGGKVGFGYLIGNGYTGGVPGTDGNGGSFRVMWYKNTSTGPVFLKPYVYYKDQPGTYGNDFGLKYPSNGTSIQKNTWYNVKMYMKSNTGSNTDGRIKLVINGTTVMDQAIRWTTNDLQRMVKHVCFETFRGGAETYWQSSTDGYIYYDNVSFTKLQ